MKTPQAMRHIVDAQATAQWGNFIVWAVIAISAHYRQNQRVEVQSRTHVPTAVMRIAQQMQHIADVRAIAQWVNFIAQVMTATNAP
jgi:hypothetical protein